MFPGRLIQLPCLFALAAACGFADDPADLLGLIRAHMRDYLAHLPDYTCRVTLERSRRLSPQAAFVLDDRLRLDVVYAGARELYAWPGDDRFEHGIADLLPGRGMTSEGSYALHMRKLFLSDAAIFRPPVETICQGAPCIQLDFAVPASHSGYSLGGSGGSAPAALAGSVWFDRGSRDIRRLLVRVDDPPPSIRIGATREETVYGPVPFGDSVAVLPLASELLLTDRDGSQARNHSSFDQCHQYAGLATISYGAAPGAPSVVPGPPAASHAVSWPRGVDLEIALDEPIGPTLAAGDLFTATVKRTGAHVAGRLTGMQHIKDGGHEFWAIGLTLLKVGGKPELRRAAGMKPPWRRAFGGNSVFIRGAEPTLPLGFTMTWRVK